MASALKPQAGLRTRAHAFPHACARAHVYAYVGYGRVRHVRLDDHDGHDGCDGCDGCDGYNGYDGCDGCDGYDDYDGYDGYVGSGTSISTRALRASPQALYDSYLDIVKMDVAGYMAKYESGEGGEGEKSVLQMKEDVSKRLALMAATEEAIPMSVSLGLFHVNTGTIRKFLCERHQQIAQLILKVGAHAYTGSPGGVQSPHTAPSQHLHRARATPSSKKSMLDASPTCSPAQTYTTPCLIRTAPVPS